MAEAFGTATMRRIEWLTLALGALGSLWAGWHWGWRGAMGLAIGAVLSWVNFRWLKGSVYEFGRSATAQAAGQVAGVSKGAFIKLFGRFILLLIAVYVILTRSWVPGVALLTGLFASAAAVIAALIYELMVSGFGHSVNGSS